jgi:hypothetical protein
MLLQPFADQSKRAIWQRAGEHLTGLDHDQRFVPE